jgi:type I restriction enzyme S subunit
MMQRLGDYIRPVDVRNRDLKVTRLLGVSITKEFMPSIANIVGTDLSAYKVVTKGQFAYGPVTSRNGDKISVALLDGYDDAIISQAYTVFEVVDTNALDPEYLMMWFRRPEFDRYARFHSHGSAREVFDWDEMCEVQVPVPGIKEQRNIVAEYKTLQTRIDTNKKLIATLEQTAQTLFERMSLECPLDCLFDDVATIVMGQSPEGDYVNRDNDGEPLLNGPTEFGLFSPTPVQWTTTPKKMCESGDVLFCVRGSTTGRMNFANQKYAIGRGLAAIRAKKKYYHWCIKLVLEKYMQEILASATGSTFPNVSSDMISKLKIVVPGDEAMKINASAGEELVELIGLKSNENQTLTQMQTLLLSKMGV